MRLLYLLSILFTAIFASAQSQSAVIDSLNQAIVSATQDSSRVKILIELSKQYDLTDSTGLVIAKKAFNTSKGINSEKIIADGESNLGQFYLQLSNDSSWILLNSALSRYDEFNLPNKKSDTYWNVGLVYQNKNKYDSAVIYYEQSLALAEENEYNLGIGDASYSLGVIHNIRGDNSEALTYSLKAKEFYEKDGNRSRVSEALNQIGIVYDYMGLYSDALDNYHKAREIAIEIKDVDGEILILNNLGVVHDKLNNTEEAKAYYEEALEKSGIFEYREDEATLLNNLSYIYLEQADTLRAKQALWKSISISKEVNTPCFEIYPLDGIGALYVAQNQLDSAQFYIDRAIAIGTTCEDVGILTSSLKSQGILYQKQGKYTSALTSFNRSLEIAKKAGLSSDEKAALKALYQFQKDRGSRSEALVYLERYQQLSDSLLETNNIEKANQLAAEYEFRKQVETIKAEQLASEMALEEEIEAQRKERFYIFLALILLALLLLTMWRSFYLIRKQNKKLRWLNEEKNTLMGVVAHDLRSPLNMIKGLMQLVVGVKTATEEDDSDKYLHLIRMSTQKMADMIDKVLDISAIENMKVNLDMSRENLTKLLEKSSENFEIVAAKKDIKIEQQYDINADYFAEVDANYFEQIMDNLISNGIKFSDPGKKLFIDLKSEAGYQLVSVKDEGPGIGEEEQKSLFNRFKTLAAKPTSDEKSTGLGLSIVKKFVAAMDGEIFCESELGKGTTFHLKFKEA